MGLLYDHLFNQAMDNGGYKNRTKVLRDCAVFEISNVVPLFDDWRKAAENGIPKRPPVTPVWCESDSASLDPEAEVDYKLGALIESISSRDVLEIVRNEELRREVAKYDEFYTCMPFCKSYRIKSTARSSMPRQFLNVIFSFNELLLVTLGQDATKVDMFFLKLNDAATGIWGTRAVGRVDSMLWNTCWPPFLAFSLLHCKNVSTETVAGIPNLPRLMKRGWPPLKKEHKVLRLELPNDVRPHAPTDEERESERKMRFHLCRGHFKNLQHERYKQKGWHWWPAHWKGSKDLGRVDKSYELKAVESSSHSV